MLLQQHLNIHNLATTNAILMKLTTLMYLHERKTSKNERENQIFGPLTISLQLNKNCQIRVALLYIAQVDKI